MTAFSISEKMFIKIENLMCALRAHINRGAHINRTYVILIIQVISPKCLSPQQKLHN